MIKCNCIVGYQQKIAISVSKKMLEVLFGFTKILSDSTESGLIFI